MTELPQASQLPLKIWEKKKGEKKVLSSGVTFFPPSVY
jgi:hypothetical protein